MKESDVQDFYDIQVVSKDHQDILKRSLSKDWKRLMKKEKLIAMVKKLTKGSQAQEVEPSKVKAVFKSYFPVLIRLFRYLSATGQSLDPFTINRNKWNEYFDSLGVVSKVRVRVEIRVEAKARVKARVVEVRVKVKKGKVVSGGRSGSGAVVLGCF